MLFKNMIFYKNLCVSLYAFLCKMDEKFAPKCISKDFCYVKKSLLTLLKH